MKKDKKWLKEEMKKDIEWLKDRVNQASLFTDDEGSAFGDNWVVSRNVVIGLIDQVKLELPEISESEALNKISQSYPLRPSDITWILERCVAKVWVEQPELPVIPGYVAEWIETIRELNGDMVGALIDGNYNMEVGDWLFLDDVTVNVVNSEKLMSAWRDGYTVEEKKYYVEMSLEKDNGTNLIKNVKTGEYEFAVIGNDPHDRYQDTFTEKEIKELDERYWAFKEPAEEKKK